MMLSDDEESPASDLPDLEAQTSAPSNVPIGEHPFRPALTASNQLTGLRFTVGLLPRGDELAEKSALTTTSTSAEPTTAELELKKDILESAVPGEWKRKRDDSTSLFTLVAPNVFEVQIIMQQEASEEARLRFRAVLRNSVSGEGHHASLTLEAAGTRALEGETVPVWNLTVESPEEGRSVYLVTTNQAIIKLMRSIRPDDDANQTNQRLRRKWQTQKLFRISAQDARLLVGLFKNMAYMKFRAGLVMIEWPSDQTILDYLTADKQARPKLTSAATKRGKGGTKEQLVVDLESTRVENDLLKTDIKRLRGALDQLLHMHPHLTQLPFVQQTLNAIAGGASLEMLVPPQPQLMMQQHNIMQQTMIQQQQREQQQMMMQQQQQQREQQHAYSMPAPLPPPVPPKATLATMKQHELQQHLQQDMHSQVQAQLLYQQSQSSQQQQLPMFAQFTQQPSRWQQSQQQQQQQPPSPRSQPLMQQLPLSSIPRPSYYSGPSSQQGYQTSSSTLSHVPPPLPPSVGMSTLRRPSMSTPPFPSSYAISGPQGHAFMPPNGRN